MVYMKKKKCVKNNRTRAFAEILAAHKSIPRFLLTSGGVKAYRQWKKQSNPRKMKHKGGSYLKHYRLQPQRLIMPENGEEL